MANTLVPRNISLLIDLAGMIINTGLYTPC